MNTPRPKRSDAAVIAAAAKSLAPKVKAWLMEADSGDDTELSVIEADLAKAMRWNDDGYEMAKALDGNYMPDAAFVEVLDETSGLKGAALRSAEADWVKANSIQPIPLETKVTWSRKPEAGIGVVTHNHPDGKSTVAFASLGHVREGTGRHGFVVAWEELTVVP